MTDFDQRFEAAVGELCLHRDIVLSNIASAQTDEYARLVDKLRTTVEKYQKRLSEEALLQHLFEPERDFIRELVDEAQSVIRYVAAAYRYQADIRLFKITKGVADGRP